MVRVFLKLVLCIGVGLLLASLMGCNQKKDAQVEAALGELDEFTKTLQQKVESSSDPSAGVDEAQRYLYSRQSEMTSKLATLKDVRAGQVADLEETKRKMTESLTNNLFSVMGLRTRYLSHSMADPAFKVKLDKLVSDYQALLQL